MKLEEIQGISPDEVREKITEFNEKNGRLRISVTPQCNLACTFCHTEGNPDHGSKKVMSPRTFSSLIEAFEELGGREVIITGGEPLLHPDIEAILESVYGRNFRTTVSTNGFPLKKIIESPNKYDIDQFKISLHTTKTDSTTKALLGQSWNYERLVQNIREIRERDYPVILNYTLSKDTIGDLRSVLESSLDLGCDLKIIDLEEMHHAPYHNPKRTGTFFRDKAIDPERVRKTVEEYGELQNIENANTGSSLFRYRTQTGTTILVKSPKQGKYLTQMCDGCQLKPICSEGVFALRVNTNGTYIPCILRTDTNVQAETSYETPHEDVSETLTKAIYQLMTGKFTTK